MDRSYILNTLLFSPLLITLLMSFYKDGKFSTLLITVCNGLIFLLTAVATYLLVQGEGATLLCYHQFFPSIGLSHVLQFDKDNVIPLILFSLVMPHIYYITRKREQGALEIVLFSLSHFFANLFFLSQNLLMIFVAWEAVLLPILFIYFLAKEKETRQSAINFFLYTAFGSIFLVSSIIYLSLTNSENFSFDLTSLTMISLTPKEELFLFLGFLVAFLIKVPLLPLHGWMKEAYLRSPTAVTITLSALMTKMGIYGIYKLVIPLFPATALANSTWLSLLAAVSLLYAGFIAFAQKDLKSVFAYSSFGHMSLLVFALFSPSLMAYQGVMIGILAHGLLMAILFTISGTLVESTGSSLLSYFGGIGSKSKIFTLIFAIAAFSGMAVPLTAGFSSEFLILLGAFNSHANGGTLFIALLAILGVVVTTVYTLNFLQKILFAESRTEFTLKPFSTSTKFFLSLYIVIILIVGVMPSLMTSTLPSTFSNLLNSEEHRVY